MNSPNRYRGKKTGGKKKKRMRRLLYLEAGLLLSLFVVYLYFASYYNNHFFVNTTINGVDTSNMRINRAEEEVDATVRTYTLSLKERNAVTDTIYGENIDLHTVFEEGGLTDFIKAAERIFMAGISVSEAYA